MPKCQFHKIENEQARVSLSTNWYSILGKQEICDFNSWTIKNTQGAAVPSGLGQDICRFIPILFHLYNPIFIYQKMLKIIWTEFHDRDHAETQNCIAGTCKKATTTGILQLRVECDISWSGLGTSRKKLILDGQKTYLKLLFRIGCWKSY